MKHHFDNGKIEKYCANENEIAALCNISTRTLWTRIQILREQNLVHSNNGTLILASWNDICNKYQVKQYFYYIKKEVYDNTKLEYILEAKTIQEAQKRREVAFRAKLERNKLAKAQYLRITGSLNLSRTAVMERASDCFRSPSTFNNDDKYFLLEGINADENLSCNSVAFLINQRTCASSGSYTKAKLMRNKLIAVEHRRIESNERARKSIYGTVFFNRGGKTTFLILPDKVSVL